jgi:hypothetical protein
MSIVLSFESPKRTSPPIENGKVTPPRRVTNLHVTSAEVERLIAAAGKCVTQLSFWFVIAWEL